MASMLFEVEAALGADKYSTPTKKSTGKVPIGKQFRSSAIYLVTLSTNRYEEVEYDPSLDDSRHRLMLYSSELRCYIQSKDVRFVMDFDQAYNDATSSNIGRIVSKGTVEIRYGPDSNAEIKHRAYKGSTFNITKYYNGWYYTITPTPGWVLIKNDGELATISDTSYRTSVNDGIVGIGDGSFSNARTTTTNLQQTGEGQFENARTTTINLKRPRPETPTNQYADKRLRNKANSLLTSNNVSRLIKASGIYDRADIEWYSKFNRFGCIDPYNNVTTTREYVFFTRPDLHMFDSKDPGFLNPELADLPIFTDAHKRYRPVMEQLQGSADPNNPFMNLLSNSLKSTLDLPGITAEDIQTSQNIYGTSLSYRKGSYQSDEAHEFSLEFEDTKYLEVYMLFKLFDEYERRKTWGDITPPDLNYRYRKILHDQFSIYKFIVGEDGMQILYYAKLTGVFPKSVPRDAFSDMPESGSLRFSVQFKAQFVEDMDPRILVDFNKLILPKYSVTRTLPLYDNNLGAPNPTWAATPYIAATSPSPGRIQHNYYLGWRA